MIFNVVDRKNSQRLALDDNSSVVFGVHFGEGNCDHHDSQNLVEEPSIIGIIIPNRSDQLDVFH